jgi:hypothetical protein
MNFMNNGVAVKVDRHWIVWGVWLGPLLLMAGYFALRAPYLLPLATRRAVIGLLMQNGVFTMVGLLAFPTAVLLSGAAAAATCHRDYARWIAMAIGAAAATVALVLTVLAAMGVIALIIA